MELVEGRVHVAEEAPAAVTAFADVDAVLTELAAVGEEFGATIQALDARYTAGRTHLERAVELATRAHERDDAIARDLAVEILLYAAGRRQIERALEMGIKRGRTPAVVVVDGGDEAAAKDAVAGIMEPYDALAARDTERIREFFDVSDQELAATHADLEEIVCERVALLVVEK